MPEDRIMTFTSARSQRDTTLKHDLLVSLAGLVEIWGPGQLLFEPDLEDIDHVFAISICDGFIQRAAADWDISH